MQNLGRLQTTGLGLELFHVQTNTSFEIRPSLPVMRIGKPNETINPDIDVSGLPDANIVSRIHAQIQVQESSFYIEDLGSSNGTYLNDIRLEPSTHYSLKPGDKIDLGQNSKVTFIFRHKQQDQTNIGSISNPTVIQTQQIDNQNQHRVDRTSKILGASLIVAAILILAASTQVGFFVRLPGVLLSIAGVAVLVVGRVNRIIGWLLILGGIAVIAFTGGIFASINLLSVLVASALFAAGYQLFTSGKVWKYDLQTLQVLVKKHRGN
ncbi:FHA domain-containing protein [Chlorogloeopsis fritschii PCC 9212]|uniref:FHA domain-containing protein n=1 Tax=Chlorogloeopsis fritschii PCC 6912 TaxID=211165 RepID=A0A433NDX7_CHLFR|nr:FHA domain-containing protein [Chlorogloeopsis fritschii]RUR80245.1 hypothetical protein PCC6912_31050 [Chlorogloeopsis fritschii PCC 6912]